MDVSASDAYHAAYHAPSADGSTAAPDTPASSDYSLASYGTGGLRAGVGRQMSITQLSAGSSTRSLRLSVVVPDRDATLIECAEAVRNAQADLATSDRINGLVGVRCPNIRGSRHEIQAVGCVVGPPLHETRSTGRSPVRSGPSTPCVAGRHRNVGPQAGGAVSRGNGGRASGAVSPEARSHSRRAPSSSQVPRGGSPTRSRLRNAGNGRTSSHSPSPSRTRTGIGGTTAGGSGSAGMCSRGNARVGGPFSLREQLDVVSQQKMLLEFQLETACRSQHMLEHSLCEERARGSIEREKLAILAARIEQLEHRSGREAESPVSILSPPPPTPAFGSDGGSRMASSDLEMEAKSAKVVLAELDAQKKQFESLRQRVFNAKIQQVATLNNVGLDVPASISEQQSAGCSAVIIENLGQTTDARFAVHPSAGTACSESTALFARRLSPRTHSEHTLVNENARLRQDLQESRQMLARYTDELASIMPGIHKMLGELPRSMERDLQYCDFPDQVDVEVSVMDKSCTMAQSEEVESVASAKMVQEAPEEPETATQPTPRPNVQKRLVQPLPTPQPQQLDRIPKDTSDGAPQREQVPKVSGSALVRHVSAPSQPPKFSGPAPLPKHPGPAQLLQQQLQNRQRTAQALQQPVRGIASTCPSVPLASSSGVSAIGRNIRRTLPMPGRYANPPAVAKAFSSISVTVPRARSPGSTSTSAFGSNVSTGYASQVSRRIATPSRTTLRGSSHERF